MKRTDIDLRQIKLVATDCDGVLTNGGLYYSANGDVLRRFCVLDGVGFQNLKRAGIMTAIITSSPVDSIRARANQLNVDFLSMGNSDKLEVLSRLCKKNGIQLREAVYIGDDIFDIPAIEAAGVGAVPASAFDQIKQYADYVTHRGGGMGCFREVCDLILSGGQIQ